MSRRSSSVNRIDSGISRKIGSDLSKVITVADNIEAVLAAASVDLEALLDALTEATDFAGITVVPGENAHWDPVTKVLTVPTIKGDKGDTGEDLSIVAVTPQAGGAFIWEFSDGTTYTTPSLRGNKGDKGDEGDKGDSVELSSIAYQGEGVFVWSFSDGTVYQTPSLKGSKGDKGDQGVKGDKGDPITMDASIYQGNGSFLWRFSDGSTYATPDLRGVRGFRGFKGDKGDQGISVHHLKGTLTSQPEGDFGVEGETDTYTFYGDPHETIVLGWFKVRNGYNTKAYAETSIENSALAEKWASEAVDVPVKDGKYSAYHHATRAELSSEEAELSAAAAEDSETAASISEGIASNAASAATSAADTAVTASDDAEASLKDFRQRYYGSYTTAPTEDPYGGPIDLGDLYFDEVYQELKVWAEVGGTAIWKYAGAGPKGDNFSVHKVGLRSERSLYDNEVQGFCFFATDETMPAGTPLKSEVLPYSSADEYFLEGFVGGPQSLVVAVNGIIQSPAVYTVTDAGDGNYTLGIVIESDDTLVARELGRAFPNGAAYFKLSEISADWSDPVPFSQGPKGDQGPEGDTGGIEEAPADGGQYARKDNVWVEVTGGGDVEEAPEDGKQYARKDAGWEEVTGGGGGAIALEQDGIEVTAAATKLSFTDGLYVTDQGVISTSKPGVLDWSYSLADPDAALPFIDGVNNGLTWTGTTGAGFSAIPIMGLATLLPTGSYTEFTIPSAATDMSMLTLARGLPFISLYGPTEYNVLSMGSQGGTFSITANDQTDNTALAESVGTASVTFGLEIASTGIYLHRSGVRTLISSETTTTGFAVANLNAEQNGGTLTASFNPTATPPASVEAGVLSLNNTTLLYPVGVGAEVPPTVYSDYPAIVSNSSNITVGTTFDVPSKNFVLEVSSFTTTLTLPDVTALPALVDVSEIIIRQTHVSVESTVTLLGTGDVTIVGNSVGTGTGMMRAVRVGPNKWTLVSDIPRQLGTLATLNSGNANKEVRTNAQLRDVYAFEGETPTVYNLDTWVPTGTSMQRYTVTDSAAGHPSSGLSIMEWVPSGATLSGVATLTVLSGSKTGNVYSRVRDNTSWVNTWGELAKIGGGSVAPEPSGLSVSKDWETFTGTEFRPLAYLNHNNYDGMVVEIEEFSHDRAGLVGPFGVLSYFYSNSGTWEQVPGSNQFTKYLDAIVGETTSVALGAGIFNTVGKYSTMSARLEFSRTRALGSRTMWHGVKATTHGVTGDMDANNTRLVDTTALVGFSGSRAVVRPQIVFSESVTFRYRVTSKTS